MICFIENINKNDKLFSQIDEKNDRRHKLLISAIKRGGSSMDLTDLKRVIRIL